MVCARAFVMPTHNVEEAAKLKVLRAAAQLGISALDRGEFKEFTDASGLSAHLNKLADNVVLGGANGP
jgi:antitoxin ParD1/3/4